MLDYNFAHCFFSGKSFKPYGINFISLVESVYILQSRFLCIVAFSGDVQTSYANIVIRFMPVPSLTSLLYMLNAGMRILCFPVGSPSLSLISISIGLISSSSRSIHIRRSWIVSRRVIRGLI